MTVRTPGSGLTVNSSEAGRGEASRSQMDPRESFRRFPAFVQPAITFVSGKPLSGAAPLVTMTPLRTVAYDYAKYASGVAGAAWMLSLGGLWMALIPLFWILTVNASRSLASDAHYGGHGALTCRDGLDRVLANLISLSIVSANMDDYAHRHNRDHHGRMGISTPQDPDIAMINTMGFELGRDVRYYRMRLLLTLVSPRYHLLSLYFRLRTTFVTGPAWRVALALVAAAAVAAATYATGGWQTLLVAWLIPILPGFALSSALQFPSEHNWLAPKRPGENHRQYVMRVSWGRFFLVRAPEPGRGVLGSAGAWCRWGVEMVPHVLARAFVCVATLPAHDYHHTFAARARWPMALYSRQREQDEGVPYQDYYGLGAPNDRVFETWASLPSDLLGRPRTLLSLIETLLASRGRKKGWAVQ